MYWFQDIESARAVARLYSKSPHLPCRDGVPQDDPDELRPPAAEPLIDQPTTNDVAAGRTEAPR